MDNVKCIGVVSVRSMGYVTVGLCMPSITHVSLDVFLFQAEDGIRDLVRSRGLGDVYKRQAINPGLTRRGQRRTGHQQRRRRHPLGHHEGSPTPVSYTHLTLPTSDLV